MLHKMSELDYIANHKVLIEGRELILSINAFVPGDKTAEIKLDLGDGDNLDVVLDFKEDDKLSTEKSKSEPRLSIKGNGEKGGITFINWTATFGSSISHPIKIASDNTGAEISFMGNVVKLGTMYKTELQFMRGSASNAK